MTEEENNGIVFADVKHQLAPKHPDPKEKIDPIKTNRCLDNLTRPPPPPLATLGLAFGPTPATSRPDGHGLAPQPGGLRPPPGAHTR